jgi:hypothetical protein
MKFKLFLISLALLVMFGGAVQNVQAQKKSMNYTKSITANPVALAFNIFNATYEQQIGPVNSFTAFGSYYGAGSWSAFALGGSYRWYLMSDDQRPIKGLSAGPLATLSFWNSDVDGVDGITGIGIGGEIAYKWVFNEGFAIEPIVQLNYMFIEDNISYSPLGVGVNLGYSW